MIIKELFAKLGLDIDDSGFEKANTLIYGLKFGLAAVTGLVAAAGTGLAALVLHTSEVADHLDETAQAAGLTTDTLQELAYAASFSGMGVDDMAGSLGKLTRNMAAAADGGEEQAKAFASIGVQVRNADGSLRDSADVLQDIAAHFSDMPDGAEKTALAMKLFGKSGASMIPFLNAGADGIAELRAEARELGMVMNEDTIKAGAELDDTITRLKASAQGLGYTIGGSLLGAVNQYGKAALDWVKANRDLIRQRLEKVVAFLAFVMGVLLKVILGVGKVLGWVIDNWKLLAIILQSVVWAALMANVGALYTLIAQYAAAGTAGVYAAVKTAAAWLLAHAPLMGLIAILALFLLVFEDISVALRGGDSLLKAWLADWRDDQPGDSWWQRALKSLIYGILHFDEIMEFWKGQFREFWDWLTEGFDKTWKSIKRGIKRLFGITDNTDTSADIAEGTEFGFKDDAGKGPGEWRRIGNSGELRFFPFGTGVSPAAQALGAGPDHLSKIGDMSVDISVYPPEGASPKEIANQTADAFDERYNSRLEEAAASY